MGFIIACGFAHGVQVNRASLTLNPAGAVHRGVGPRAHTGLSVTASCWHGAETKGRCSSWWERGMEAAVKAETTHGGCGRSRAFSASCCLKIHIFLVGVQRCGGWKSLAHLGCPGRHCSGVIVQNGFPRCVRGRYGGMVALLEGLLCST